MNTTNNNNIDDHIDEKLKESLDKKEFKSFFLFAGAGSGKTRSLVKLLEEIKRTKGIQFKQQRQKVGIITYTNAACDEIKYRLDNDSLFFVSTIHSFIWELIKPYPVDLKKEVEETLTREIGALKVKNATLNPNTKSAKIREAKIVYKNKRLKGLPAVKKFTYSPTGANKSHGALNHNEVIKIGAFLLNNKPLLRRILIQKYPILLIDESQDTKKELMEAFISVQEGNKEAFALGLFGDTMQRIYSDGKVDMVNSIPKEWYQPVKQMNHRCPKRVVTLLNKVCSVVNMEAQKPRVEKEEGVVRVFIASPSTVDKKKKEEFVAKRMQEITGDEQWFDRHNVKTLILEHRMAANRMGFLRLFNALYKIDSTGCIDGSIVGVTFFTHILLPIYEANRKGDNYGVLRIVKKYSDFLQAENLKNEPSNIKEAREATKTLLSLWNENKNPKLRDIVINVRNSKLFPIPSPIKFAVLEIEEEEVLEVATSETDEEDKVTNAWKEILEVGFDEMVEYNKYISGQAEFDTHQGVKGLEFERVAVVIDDEAAKGFLFRYGKLFGIQPLSTNDDKNASENKETGIDRTRRLFYVTCSRAQKSLAIIIYSAKAEELKSKLIEMDWFSAEEIEILE